MLDVVWLIPALPLAGFLLILLFGRRLGDPRPAIWRRSWCSPRSSSPSACSSICSRSTRHERDARRDAVLVGAGRLAAGRHGVPGRSAQHHHVPVRHRHRHADPPVRRSATCTATRGSRSSSCTSTCSCSACAPGAGREPARHVPRLGGRRHVLVLPDRVLARACERGHGRQEGLRHQPRRRLGLHDGDVLRLPGHRHAELPRRSTRPPSRPVEDDRHRDRAVAVRRRVRQERTAAAVPVAARRDGRPDAGVGADPRRHDGDRRRVPDVPHDPMLAAAAPEVRR